MALGCVFRPKSSRVVLIDVLIYVVARTREIRRYSTLVPLDQVPHQIGAMHDGVSRRSAGVGTAHIKFEWRSGVDII